MDNWLLPEYIEDILPPEAWRIETTRRAVLDLLRSHGYQLVVPPMLEYVESLLTGTGHDMDLATFKLVDQLSGRHMGLRADITPQTARIDAHLMNRQGVNRLCYAGSVLRTLPEGLLRTREPLQIGAELFGHAGRESDVEIQRLLLEALHTAGVPDVMLDVGHVAIFRALARRSGMDPESEAEMFRVMQSKDRPALKEMTRSLSASVAAPLQLLPELNGGVEVLARARKVLPAYPEISRALDDLEILARTLQTDTALSFDLAELRGYHYHSGVVFAAYAKGYSDAVAKGGRYDEVGRTFGRARPATGFSMDLREIATGLPPVAEPGTILAPFDGDAGLQARITALRAAGEVVVTDLPGSHTDLSELNCDRKLVRNGGRWEIVKV